MPRHHDAPWVVLGTGAARGVHTKQGVFGKDRRTGMWGLYIYEYDEAADKRTGLYQVIWFANQQAVADLCALLADGLTKWMEAENEKTVRRDIGDTEQ